MYVRIHPFVHLGMLAVGALVIIFMALLSALPEQDHLVIPDWMLRLAIGIYTVVFGYWIIDLLISTEKRGPWMYIKGRIAMMVAATTIFCVYPWHWYGTPVIPTLAVAATLGIVLPSIYLFFRMLASRKPRLSPNAAEEEGRRSPESKRFLKRFPDAAAYVYGLSERESNRIHVLYHKRERIPVDRPVFVDYCLDVPIDMKLWRVLGGTEKLICYLFLDHENGSHIGFLPTSNIGRVLDVGYNEAELEDAYQDALENGNEWPILGDLPMPVRKFNGRTYRVR